MTRASDGEREARPGDSGDEPDDEAAAGDDEEREDDHLDDLSDGSGCTEIWEHLSERRRDDDG